MIEIADEKEADLASLAYLEVVIPLASIHTSQMNAVHCLYDLVIRPTDMEILERRSDRWQKRMEDRRNGRRPPSPNSENWTPS